MRFSLQLPTDRVDAGSEFVGFEAVAEISRAAEAAGFDAVFVTDHPFAPDRWLAEGGHQALDPFVALSFAAAATGRLRLQTHILVAGYRNPFLTARAAASLDVLSGGRLLLGMAAGYLRGEFRALGVDPDERNELADEAILAIRAAWTGESVHFRGRHFEARGHTMLPRPVQRPGPPILVGGNSRRAIRRAVELGDGWVPFPSPKRFAPHVRTAPLETAEDLARRIDYAREHAERVGRTAPLEICFSPLSLTVYGSGDYEPAALREEIAALADLGVGRLTLGLRGRDRRELVDAIARFGEEVIAPVRREVP